jgi:pyroglutamyl-peptidase
VYLHLGVAANNTKFKIETTAWNEASFRVPDERGWEPASQPIYPEDGKVSLN